MVKTSFCHPLPTLMKNDYLVFIWGGGNRLAGPSIANFTPIARALVAPLIDQMNFSTQYVKMCAAQWRYFYFRLQATQFLGHSQVEARWHLHAVGLPGWGCLLSKLQKFFLSTVFSNNFTQTLNGSSQAWGLEWEASANCLLTHN